MLDAKGALDGVEVKTVTKTPIDRLGQRLKKGNITEADVRLLDEYRRSFAGAYETVVGSIRQQLGLEPTGRPTKTTNSVAEKLRRESIRLTQIQDIAGCRLVVTDIVEQDRIVAALARLFPNAAMVDRRERPSHGYRAVHVIVTVNGKTIEIQVRTILPDLWGTLSERYSDAVDPAIKYGRGNPEIVAFLATGSSLIAGFEAQERRVAILDLSSVPTNVVADARVIRAEITAHKNELAATLAGMIKKIGKQ